MRDLITSITGSDLYIRNTASAAGAEINVTASITSGKGAVRDLDVSPDGTKVVFSLRLPLDPNTEKRRSQAAQLAHLSVRRRRAKTVTQLTNDDITAGHDVGAHYLAGRADRLRLDAPARDAIDTARRGSPAIPGRDRRPAAGHLPAACHERGRHATCIRSASTPTMISRPRSSRNGQIVFSRWEVTNGTDQISLYVTNPDGTRRAALLRREQPRHRRQHRGHEQQRHSVPECAPARGRQAARHSPAVSRHAARRRHGG